MMVAASNRNEYSQPNTSNDPHQDVRIELGDANAMDGGQCHKRLLGSSSEDSDDLNLKERRVIYDLVHNRVAGTYIPY